MADDSAPTTSASPASPGAPSRLGRWLAPTRRRIVFGVVCLVVAGGVYWWLDVGRRWFFPRNWAEIEPGLFRSGQLHARLVEDQLTEHRIELIIDLDKDDAWDENEQKELEVAKRLGIRKVSLEGVDGSGVGDLEVYVTALTELVAAKKAGTRTLLHCVGGSQRTGAATAWYRMLFHGWSGERAYREYRVYRKKSDGNRLADWVIANTRRLAERLVETGALDKVPDPLPVFGRE